ncbi:MAG: Type secretion system domain protein [Ilumatobacteraceae bacterium]|nr:Type secretion system domain protein [Ilumatobacteraceae bacterium]
MSAATAGSVALLVAVIGSAFAGRMSRHRVARRLSADLEVTSEPAPPRRSAVQGIVETLRVRLEDRRRSRGGVDAALVAALLDRTARHCASGEALGPAFAAAIATSPLASTLTPAAAALAAGQTVEQALDRQPSTHPHLSLAIHAVRLCASQGGNISQSLDRAATTLRERHAIAMERRAQSSQARLSARILTVLPLAFGGWSVATSRSVQRFVFTPAGTVCVTAGIALNIVGWLLMQRVVRGST